MEIRMSSLYFPSMCGGGPRLAEQTVIFPRPVARAVTALSGYSAQFGDQDDHNFGRLEITVTSTIVANTVTVRVSYGLRDWSGSWDDQYAGLVDVIVFADLEAQAAGLARRNDLTITGIETTQAIQYYRSAHYLNISEAGPDNSIPLIARKDTALRVYVDYSPAPAAAVFSMLSGEVNIQTSSGATLTLAPVAVIAPRSDASIDRKIASHTLNFVIPEVWCQGQIELSCEVFDNGAPTQRSTAFRRTLQFIEVAPLSTFAVGVHYLGQGLNLPAPSLPDAINTLDMATRLFPVGEILVNGYTTIDFNEDMNANIADGCGDGFNDLLDVLRDLRGDSEDLYYAILPSGINTGSVGGCGGGGAAAQFAGDDWTLIEEFGHALGRKHAPAGTSPAPADPDEHYPTYGTYPSGSIGEIGYDPATNTVLDPASTFDFMGYAGPEWISPYTFAGLLGSMKVMEPSPGPAMAQFKIATQAIAAKTGEVRRQKHQTLFLKLSISRDRKVSRDFLFHFPAFPSRVQGIQTDFSLEFQDAERRTLACSPMLQVCIHCQPSCWPKRFRQNITLPDKARWLVIWEGRKKIYEEFIPDPPEVWVEARPGQRQDVTGIEIRWKAIASRIQAEDQDARRDEYLVYLVQWQDAIGNWRGAAPRTKECEIFIPFWQLQFKSKSSNLRIRVLASSGIATGCGEVEINDLRMPRIDPALVLQGEKGGAQIRSSILRISILNGYGLGAIGAHIRWFDEQGHEIGRGRTLDLRSFPPGSHRIHADAIHLGVRTVEASWLIEKSEAGVRIIEREPKERLMPRKKSVDEIKQNIDGGQ
jgi:hypothetical protein